MDLVHLIGAIGCALLVAGFAADGESGRTLFYLALVLAFSAALVHRRQLRRVPARPTLVDLRTTPAPHPARH